ncbi:hypothetical protein CIL03_16305 [Virgibacillus indicus]|uniref:Uncharacterized protein n=1 Tax=Virgibacillus indicus TaxID=2024554 RepID=A0A265N6K2_9BACI|nr:hypothetical protein CIL03_16305 [Virgibacillus indicus]
MLTDKGRSELYRYKALWIGVILLAVLTGCWDEKEIGEIAYVTAIGIDYKDENYILYVQLLDFSNVAKQEGQKNSESAPLFVGKSSGKTFHEAVNNLYKTSQQPLNWGQIGSIIYSEAVLEKGIETIQQSIQRNPEFRFTPWMFGAKGSIEELFAVSGFFHLPPVYTIMYQPEDTYKVYSYIKPLRMYNFFSIYNAPGATAVLPSITVDKNAWRKFGTDEQPKKTLRINGGFQITEGKYQDWMSYEDLTGVRWVESKTNITPVKIIDNEKEIGIVEITSPSARIKLIGNEGEAKFEIKIKAKGIVADLREELNQSKIESLVKKQIKEEIRTTYQKGLEKNIDIYNLKNKLFRNGVNSEKLKKVQLSEDSLNKITVDFHLESSGILD